MEGRGMIQLYYGDGKGKTTAALGLAIRAAGSGMKVVIVQFLKNQPTSELAVLDELTDITVIRGKEGAAFSFSMTEEQKEHTKVIHSENLKAAMDLARSGNCDLLVLDEVVGACRRGLVDQLKLQSFVNHKPQELELVMTGRNPAQWMIDCADYVSEIRKVKHPFEKGIPARVGIEK